MRVFVTLSHSVCFQLLVKSVVECVGPIDRRTLFKRPKQTGSYLGSTGAAAMSGSG